MLHRPPARQASGFARMMAYHGCRAVRLAVGATYWRPPVYAFLRIGKWKLTQRRGDSVRRAAAFGRRCQPDASNVRHPPFELMPPAASRRWWFTSARTA